MTSLPISETDRQSIYTGRTTAWPMVIGTCLGAALLALMSRQGVEAGSDPTVSMVFIAIAIGIIINVLTSSSVRATAGPNGFTIRWGIVGWPRAAYAITEIERAEVFDLSWWRVTWSYWWTPRRTSCTLRSGPTVRLVLRSGRIVTVTVPEPEAAVAAVHEAMAAAPPEPR